jgi:hypothetical protein
MGLRTVTVEHPVSYAYPTSTDVDRAMDLLQRVGAETVVGVGSSSAMDLAKAVMQSSQSQTQSQSSSCSSSQGSSSQSGNLILVPATYGAVLTAGASSHSLLLDTAEEALTVYPPYQSQQQSDHGGGVTSTSTTTITSVALEATMLDDSRRTNALLASIAIALPVWSARSTAGVGGGQDDAATALGVIQNAVACLNKNDDANDANGGDNKQHTHNHELAVRTVATAGTLMSYGLDQQGHMERSIPLALAACLIPKHFSEHNQVTFMASLLPAMLYMYLSDDNSDIDNSDSQLLCLDELTQQQIRQHCLVSTPRMVTTEPMETLMASIRENQALWNCLDARDATLVQALKQHCLV